MALFELRDYQRTACEAIYAALQTKLNVLLVAIMGAGKTAMAVSIVERTLTDRPESRVLVLAHKQELLEQFRAAFGKFTQIPDHAIGISCAGLNKRKTSRPVTLASVQTFVNQVADYPGASLVIVDECHRVDITNDSMYRTILDGLRKKRPACRILGITATPMRLGHGYIFGRSCKHGNVNLFDKVDHCITYKQMLDGGYLMPIQGEVCVASSLAADLSNVGKVGHEYNLGHLGDVMGKPVHIQTAVEALKEFGGESNHVVAFACTIAHAEALQAAFITAGETCSIVHSQLSPLERASNMRAWESGETRVIAGVNILAEGYDFPAADCILMARPTMSPTLYLQVLGRIARIHPDKQRALLIDLTDNTERFGTDLDNIKPVIPSSSNGEKNPPSEKVCPVCLIGVHPAVRVCPDCGNEFGVETIPAAFLPQTKTVEFEGSYGTRPRVYDVVGMDVTGHASKSSGKRLIKITLDLMRPGGSIFSTEKSSVWICCPDHYQGFAVTKGREKWDWFSAMDYPETVEDGVERLQAAGLSAHPARAVCTRPDRWLEIQSVEFDEELHIYTAFADDEVPF